MECEFWPAALLAAPAFREPGVPLWVMEWTASVLLHLWLFCVGACVGSFLNVVVYRLPRGKSLSHPGSCCPQCGHPIRLWDNIPILSWLLLGGRCRDCRTSISPRYFWIELLVATLFLAVALWERAGFAGVWGHDARPPLSPHDLWPYWCRYATHVVLLTTLLGGVLILGDHFGTKPRLFLPAIILAFLLPLIWPEIRSIPAFRYGPLAPWQAGLIDGLAALSLGLWPALVGSLWHYASKRKWLTFSPISWMAALALTLGWQRSLLWSPPLLLLYLFAAGALRAFSPQDEATSGATDLPITDAPTTDPLPIDPQANQPPPPDST